MANNLCLEYDSRAKTCNSQNESRHCAMPLLNFLETKPRLLTSVLRCIMSIVQIRQFSILQDKQCSAYSNTIICSFVQFTLLMKWSLAIKFSIFFFSKLSSLIGVYDNFGIKIWECCCLGLDISAVRSLLQFSKQHVLYLWIFT